VRVLVLNQYFHPDSAATAQLLTELCEDLARQHKVHVVTGRPSYNPSRPTRSRGIISRESHAGVQVSRVWSTTFDRSSMAGRLANYGTYLGCSLAGALMAGRPDVVLAMTDPPPVGLIGVLVARLRGVPFVLATQDIFPDVAIQLGRLTNPAAVIILRSLSRRLFGAAERVVSIGRDMDRRLVALGVTPERIVTIQGWADVTVVRPLDRPSGLRREWGLEDRFVVMPSGNVGLSQDLETLLETAALLADRTDIAFLVVGEGAARPRLEREARSRGLENVIFRPYQPKALLSESLGAADLHLVSLRRGLAGYMVPSKVYGILAAGKPIVAAVEEGSETALVLEEYGCGRRVEPGDPAALAAAILGMREAPLQEIGRRARTAAEERYNRTRASSAYLSLLEEVTAKRKTPTESFPLAGRVGRGSLSDKHV
jgi:colanic acid biosynthesis glycosyl transferase WcaI